MMDDSLATAVLHALSLQHSFAYARVQPNGIIAACSSNMPELLATTKSNIVGQLVTAVFPELIGADTGLLAVRQQREPFYRLAHVNHVQEDGTVRYLSVQLTAVSPQGLLLLVEDRTEDGRLRQLLEQTQNELSLLRRQIQG